MRGSLSRDPRQTSYARVVRWPATDPEELAPAACLAPRPDAQSRDTVARRTESVSWAVGMKVSFFQAHSDPATSRKS